MADLSRLQACYVLASEIEWGKARYVFEALPKGKARFHSPHQHFDPLAMVCLAELLYSRGYGTRTNSG